MKLLSHSTFKAGVKVENHVYKLDEKISSDEFC